jgi:hypothetical protein
MAVARALEGFDAPHLGGLKPELSGGSGTSPFLRLVPDALPGHEAAGRIEERRGVLHEHGERGERSCGHEVVGLTTRAGPPLLGPSGYRVRIREPCGASEPLDHLALTPGRLHQIHARARQRRRQHQAGETRAGADVRDRSCVPHLFELEPAETVGDVLPQRVIRIADGRRRVRLGRERLEQALQAIGNTGRKAVASPQSGERFP